MPKKKGTWVYYFSHALNMKYAFNTETGEVMTEDKVKYEPDELEALTGKQITPAIHMVKKIFNGKVVK